MPVPVRHPIRAVARLTGLSVDTLRAWERRYRAVAPVRGARGRAYTDRQVERLKHLAALVATGHTIGSIATLPDSTLINLAAQSPADAAAEPRLDLAPVMRAMRHYDLPALEAVINRHALLLPPSDLIFQVLLPVLREAGRRWEAGTVRPAQEHLASSLVRGVLGGLLRSLSARRDGAPMVFATPAGERHELGLLCGAVLAAAAGHQVIYLGPDLPSSDIVHAVATAKAKMLVLAATAHATPAGEIRKLTRLPSRVEIWTGGPLSSRLRQPLGDRARPIASLENLQRLLVRAS